MILLTDKKTTNKSRQNINLLSEGRLLEQFYASAPRSLVWPEALFLFCSCVRSSVRACVPDVIITRKLCYRKDDRAMRPMGALKIFGTP